MSSDNKTKPISSMFDPKLFINSNGTFVTSSSFYEIRYILDDLVIFTTDTEDKEVKGKKLVSLYKLYMAYVCNDPTEYTFAMSVFGSWPLWEAMRNNKRIKKFYDGWKNEAEVKIKSEALQTIIAEAKSEGSKNSYSAAKFLQAKGWEPSSANTPISASERKAKRLKDKQQDDEALALVEDDAARLGLLTMQ